MDTATQHITGLGSRSRVIHAVPASEVERPTGPGYGNRYRAACGKPVTAVVEHQPFEVTPDGGADGANCSQCVRRLT